MTETKPEPHPRRRRWTQYRLRTLLAGLVVASIGMSWIAVKLEQARKQRKAVAEFAKFGGALAYDYNMAIYENGRGVDAAFRWKAWFGQHFGEGLFSTAAVLYLANTQVTDAALGDLTEMPQLRVLYLQQTPITDAGLEYLAGLPGLEVLYLDETHITDAGLVHLERLDRLEQLTLGGTEISDAGLVHLKGFSRLQCLYLGGTRVTDEGISYLQHALPHCKIITKPPATSEPQGPAAPDQVR